MMKNKKDIRQMFLSYINRKKKQKKDINGILEVIKLLTKYKIEYIVLRGITLQNFTDDRHFFDLDIFVHKQDVMKVARLLINKLDYFVKHRLEISMGVHHLNLYHENRIEVEIHYFLARFSFIKYTDIINLAKKQYLTINEIQVPCLSPELQLIDIFLHIIYGHGFFTDYDKWLHDINDIVENYEIHWRKFIIYCKKLNSLEIIYRAICLLNNFSPLKLKIPFRIIRKIHLKSSKFRMYLTKSFNIGFLRKYKKLEKKIVQDPRAYYWWRIRNSLIFNIGFNLCFLKLIYYYLILRIPHALFYRYKVDDHR